MDKVVEELNSRLGWEIEEARDFEFEHNGDASRLDRGATKVFGIIHYSFKMDVLKIQKIIN